MNSKKRHEIFSRFQNALPNPTTELIYHSTFELLVAVILSAQATDKSVNQVTKRFFPTYANPEKLLALGEEKFSEYIKTIGLFRNKSKNVMLMCEQLLKLHEGKVPNTREALENLAGVGRKTANVILNTAFGKPTIAVDTHIFRVANRIGLAKGKHVLEVELKLEKTTPPEFKQNAHHWLILHGRYTCKARKPECWDCLIKDLCEYPQKTGGMNSLAA